MTERTRDHQEFEADEDDAEHCIVMCALQIVFDV